MVLCQFNSTPLRLSINCLAPGAPRDTKIVDHCLLSSSTYSYFPSMSWISKGMTRCSLLYRRYGDKVLRLVLWVHSLQVLPSAGSYRESHVLWPILPECVLIALVRRVGMFLRSSLVPSPWSLLANRVASPDRRNWLLFLWISGILPLGSCLEVLAQALEFRSQKRFVRGIGRQIQILIPTAKSWK